MTQAATQTAGGYLNLSPSPFHPLLRDDIKWKWYAFGRQEADKQEAQLSLSFVQPAVKYTQEGLDSRSRERNPSTLPGRRR